jgi:hypothetical protein
MATAGGSATPTPAFTNLLICTGASGADKKMAEDSGGRQRHASWTCRQPVRTTAGGESRFGDYQSVLASRISLLQADADEGSDQRAAAEPLFTGAVHGGVSSTEREISAPYLAAATG